MQIVNKIKDYFERFGEVEKVRVHSKDTFQYGFVQFKTTDAAKLVLARSRHWIGNCSVKVKAADRWHQPDKAANPQFPPPDFDSDLNILNALNDDCLRVIFKYLSMVDLVNAAEVCVRFNQHAQQAFSSKHKNVLINEKSKIFARSMGHDQRLQTLESMFRNFGTSIRSLTISPVCRDPDNILYSTHYQVLQMIEKHAARHLKELKLMDFQIRAKLVQSTFSNIERLELIDCTMSNQKGSVVTASNLKVLHIEASEWKQRLINQQFNTVKEIHLIRNPNLTDFQLSHFVTSYPSLNKLVIRENDGLDRVGAIRLVGQRLQHLVELEIDQDFTNSNMREFQKSVESLSQLKCLKSLTLNFLDSSVEPLMKGLVANNVPIEQLTLKLGGITNDAIEAITKLKQIKTLELIDMEDLMDMQMVDLVKHLPLLQHFTLEGISADELNCSTLKDIVARGTKLSSIDLKSIDYVLSIEDDDYKTMLRSVQSRPQKVQLSIEVSGRGSVIDFDEELLQKNRDWLNINEQVLYDGIDALEFILDHGLGLHDWFQSDDEDDFDMFSDTDSDDSDSDDNEQDFSNLVNGRHFDLD